MRRADLPGFYFDTEKDRYFPLSHQKKARTSDQSADNASPSAKGEGKNKRHAGHRGGSSNLEGAPDPRILALLRQREISGNRRYGQSRTSAQSFQSDYLEMHTVQPRVSKYRNTNNCADGGLEQLRVSLQTLEGEVEADVMIIGGTNCELGVRKIAKPSDRLDLSPCFPADHYLRENPDLLNGNVEAAPTLWPSMRTAVLPSKITSVKKLNKWSDSDRVQDGQRLEQNVIVTTLGDGVTGGALYLLHPAEGHLSNPPHRHICALPFRLSRNVTTSQSVWTSESNPRGRTASLGMSSGAGIVDLERKEMSWLCRSSSDVLAQQFDSSGNVVLCGFRNGVISTIDLRLPQTKSRLTHAVDLSKSRRKLRSWSKWQGARHHTRDRRPLPNIRKTYQAPHQAAEGLWSVSDVDKLYCSHSTIMQMQSAICCLALLRSSEWYLLASAMNGEIQQWDRRAVERGPLRTFVGHCNTHTVLQFALDPTERLLVSGAEDTAVRFWSLESGRLLHTERDLESPVTTVSWPTLFRTSDSSRWGGYWEEPPFEVDFAWALWMGSSSGLLHMRGATTR